MNKVETAKVLAAVAAVYPQFQVSETTHEVWRSMLSDLKFADVQVAVQRHICLSKFPPTIAEVRAALIPPRPPVAEIWGEVYAAVKRYGLYRKDEAMAALSPQAAMTVALVGWDDLCLSVAPDVMRSNFFKAYREVADRQREEDLLPARLRQPDPLRQLEDKPTMAIAAARVEAVPLTDEEREQVAELLRTATRGIGRGME